MSLRGAVFATKQSPNPARRLLRFASNDSARHDRAVFAAKQSPNPARRLLRFASNDSAMLPPRSNFPHRTKCHCEERFLRRSNLPPQQDCFASLAMTLHRCRPQQFPTLQEMSLRGAVFAAKQSPNPARRLLRFASNDSARHDTVS
jgi:hypothetical protein